MTEGTTYEQGAAADEATSSAVAGDSEALEQAVAGEADKQADSKPAEAEGPIPLREVDWASIDFKEIDRIKSEDLPPELARLRADRDRALQEAAYYRRQVTDQPPKQPAPKVPAEHARPQRPGPEASQESWDAYEEALVEWKADEKVRAAVDPIHRRLEQQEQAQRAQWYAGQYARIQKLEGYSAELDQAMADLAARQEFAPLLNSEEGLNALFEIASSRLGKQAATKRKVQRLNTARERVVPRPSEGSRSGESEVKGESAGDVFLELYRQAASGG